MLVLPHGFRKLHRQLFSCGRMGFGLNTYLHTIILPFLHEEGREESVYLCRRCGVTLLYKGGWMHGNTYTDGDLRGFVCCLGNLV